MAQQKGSDFSNLRIKFTEQKKKTLKLYCRYLFPEKKKERRAFFPKNQFIRTKRKQQKQNKKKISFLLIYLLKLAFKPNKSQESQVPSQDHHNQNGENPLKEESIQH